MPRPRPSRSSIALFLGLLFGLCLGPGCIASVGNSSPQADSSKAAATEKKSDDAKDSAKAVAEARHDLEVAGLELDLAESKGTAERTKREQALATAEAERAEAEADLQVFLTSELPTKIGKGELDLERARNRVIDSEAELAELEAMYAEEEFAASTKEIVLSRGRRNLTLARRGLELKEAEQVRLVDHELPKKERGLRRALENKANALAAARRSLERHQLEQRLALTKAERASVKAEQELEEAREKLTAADEDKDA